MTDARANEGQDESPRKPAPASPAPRRIYREVIDTIDPDFLRAFELYNRTFPPEERISRDYFVIVLESKRSGRMSPDNFRFVVCREGATVVAMCTGRYIEALNIGFVGYLVVDPEHRNDQIGSVLRRHLVRGFKRDAELAGHGDLEAAMGEVEPTNHWIATLIRRRKVLALDLEYCQPPLVPGGPAVPLVLYYQPVASSNVPESLPAEKVERFLHSIFREIYRIPEPDACETYRTILASIQGRECVGQVDLEAAKLRMIRKPSHE